MWFHDKAETLCICAQQQKETTRSVFKGTVSIISSDHSCKDNNDRVT